MTLKSFLAPVCAAAVIVASPAFAGEMASGPYVGISAVGSSVSDVKFSNNRSSAAVAPNTGLAHNTAAFDDSVGGSIRVGYDFGWTRIEIEGAIRKFDVESVNDSGVLAANPSGDTKLSTVMLNGILDIETGTPLTPYILMGAGYANADGNIAYTNGNGVGTTAVSFDKKAPIGQVGGGLSLDVFDTGVALVAGYSAMILATTGGQVEQDAILIHNVNLGLTYHF